MIGSLASLGVPPEKILILFNRVQKDVKAEFPIIYAYHQRDSAFTLNPECAVFESELFDALSIHRFSMQSLMDDDTDYKTLLKNKDASVQERDHWSVMFGLKLLCKGVNRKLDHVFAELFSQEVLK
nr:hypothetical protein pPsy0479a_00125 [Pseudomonas syringae]